MKRKIEERREGYTLISIVLLISMMSILGLGIIVVTNSNVKMSKVDSKNQSTYYIAEAGVNKVINDISKKVDKLSEEKLSHEEFFEKLDEYIDKELGLTLSDFEENFGETPTAKVTINEKEIVKDESIGNNSERVVNYKISSRGEIGNSKRTVTSSIEIVHGIEMEENVVRHPAFDYAMYSQVPLKLPNQSIVKGDLYSKDIVLESAGSQINGNIISETFVDIKGNKSHPNIKGNVYALSGSVSVSTGGLATVDGSINANGNIVIGSDGTVSKDVFSTGDIKMLSANAKVMGNVHTNGNIEMQSGTSIKQNVYLDGNLTLYNSNSTIYGNVFVGGNIKKDNNTFIKGTSQAGGAINQHNISNVNMKIHPDNKPIKPKFPIASKVSPPNITSILPDMSKSISVPQSSSNYIIEPGIYGNLFVGGASTVTLKSGNYIFNSIDGGRWGESLRLDLRNGPINVYSVGDITYTGPVYVMSEKEQEWVRMDELKEEEAIPLAGMVYWETHGSFEVNNSANPRQWFGTVLADKNITVGNPVKLIGAYVVNKGKISLGNDPTVIYAPPTVSAAGDDVSNDGMGDSNIGNVKGQNIILPDLRIIIKEPIREK